jgi:hypothetical protein
MQPKPAGHERAAESTDAPEEVADVPAPASPGTPALVLRPQAQWRAVGPGLIVFALLLVAVGRLRAVPVAFVLGVAGVAFLTAWWDRLDVGATTVLRRSWRGRQKIALADVDTLRLRRVHFALLRWLPRGYKFGRYWSIPLTLRLLSGERALLELRCAWWSDWRELTRFVIAACPDVDLDGRTRGRIERYVGVPLPAGSQR